MSKKQNPPKKKTGKEKEAEIIEASMEPVSETTELKAEPKAEKKGKSRKEKKLEAKLKRKSRPLPLRILIQVTKTLFIRIPLTLVVIIAAALLFARIYLTPGTVENLAKSSFNGMSNGTIELNVEDFNPYSGFAINNIVVRSGADFNNEKLFEMERLVFRYGFFKIFTGSVRFPEIGLYKPRVYLTEKNGVWNAATLMKPSEKKPEPEKRRRKRNHLNLQQVTLSSPYQLTFSLILYWMTYAFMSGGLT